MAPAQGAGKDGGGCTTGALSRGNRWDAGRAARLPHASEAPAVSTRGGDDRSGAAPVLDLLVASSN